MNAMEQRFSVNLVAPRKQIVASLSKRLRQVCVLAVVGTVWGQVHGVAATNAGPGEADWQKYIPPNAAYQRAKARPPFSMNNPVGLVTSGPEKAQQRQAAEELGKAMATAHARGDKVFTIPPGQYRFADNRGFALKDAEDSTVVAKDVTFWFERPASMLAADPKGLELNHCRRVTVQGLKIDFDPPVFLQAKILEIDEDKPGYVVEIDPEFPDAEMKGGSYFLYRADGRWIAHGYLFYRETRRIEGRKHKVLLDDARVFQAHNRDEANLRHTQGACRIGPGDYIVLPWRRGKGISMYRCEGCVLESVDEYASPGMGILEYQGKGGNVYRRVRIIPPPGTRRLHACAADGFHNAQTDRGPQLIECEFTATSDDFINLHGHFGVVWRKLDARRYVIGQANLGEMDPGETLVFYDDETVEPLGKARLIRLAPLRDEQLIQECNAATLPNHASRNYYDITLDQDVSLSPGDLRTIQFHIGHPNYFAGKARKAAIGLWSCSHVEVRANRLIDPEGFCEHGPVQIGDHCEAIRVVNPE